MPFNQAGQEHPRPMSTANLIICEFCDAVYRRTPLRHGGVACCRSCGAHLYRGSRADLHAMLAVTLAALVMFVIANAYPLMMLSVGGKVSEATLWQMIVDTYDSNVSPIAPVAAATVFFFPLLQICLYAYVLIPLRRNRVPVAFIGVMHALRQMQPWTMVEVFMLGLLVAVVKLGGMATSTPETGMWAFAILTLLLTLLNSRDLEELWERAEQIERAAGGDAALLRPLPVVAADGLAPALPSGETHPGPSQYRVSPLRASQLDLLACHGCGLVLRDTAHRVAGFCPRCDQSLQRRKPDSQARSWAFLIAAMILYIPANVLTVMHTSTLFGADDNTILTGVVELWNGGAWDLAVIVFTASIAVPLMKMACLTLLLISSRQGSARWRRERTRIYRMVEFIGRWSMLDVFVVALLLSLVRFGILAEVQAGPGIVAFCAVVVLTMLASMSFDPRMIWDVRSSARPQPRAAEGTGA
jgi:paraquat-inducible protein A